MLFRLDMSLTRQSGDCKQSRAAPTELCERYGLHTDRDHIVTWVMERSLVPRLRGLAVISRDIPPSW